MIKVEEPSKIKENNIIDNTAAIQDFANLIVKSWANKLKQDPDMLKYWEQEEKKYDEDDMNDKENN